MDGAGSYPYQWFGNGVATKHEVDARSGRLTGITTGTAGSSLSGMVGNIQKLGFSWDSHGNLQSRSSTRTNAAGTAQEDLSETFTYDDLNRLDTATTVSGATSYTVDYDYDAFGNLTNNHIGALEYEQTNGASLYGVTAAAGNTYGYDAYGNATTLGSRTAQYNVFNKPTRIGTSEFVYGPGHEKVKTVSGGTTTYQYAGGTYIVEGTSSKTYVDGYYLRETTAGTTTESYLHFDHLGSVEAISDADGNFVSRMSFDAYGNRRNSDWTQDNPAADFATNKGFTGHDMVDEEGMVHMGGRVYDPSIGRFLSADLYVQSPDSSQSYSRYSYVHNNPLSFVDPSGYVPCNATACEEVTVIGHIDGSTGLTGMDAMNFLNDMAFYDSGSMMAPFAGFSSSAWDSSVTSAMSNLANEYAQEESRVITYEEYLDEIQNGGAKIGKLSRSDRELAEALSATEEFMNEATRIYREAKATGRETQGIRIYLVNGTYQIETYTGKPCSNGSTTCMIPPGAIPYESWKLVMTWHPHPNGSKIPSSSDYISNSHDDAIGSLWYQEGRSTFYRGERLNQ